MAEHRQYCTFFLEGVLFGIPVEQVQEVIRRQPMTRVPLAPPAVRGLINLRGQIVTAIDLRTSLRLGGHVDEAQAYNVVVRSAHGAVSFLVDEIGEVCTVNAADLDEPPRHLHEPLRSMIHQVYRLESRTMLVLDAARSLEAAAMAAC
ncbi:MAG: chemotaxis protein CheW [Planctomycetota bacterium]|nr:MAG: chemotaxis protein CheW [Planctomycetota bacterium]